MSTTTDLSFGDDELVTVPWSLIDETEEPVIPYAITAIIGDRSGETELPVVDDGDGSGAWVIDCAALGVGFWRWHFLVAVGGQIRRPTGMSGTLRIRA